MRRHYSRYTPEMVERVCGIPKAEVRGGRQARTARTAGPEKTGSITYALNLTQHTNGVQNIRALCMLQILLGNIGRPGGGVVALRGHANVQGATDLELLYHELPGYLPMPLRDHHPDLKTYLEKVTPKGGFWVNLPKFMVSLLKAFYGDAATKPRTTTATSGCPSAPPRMPTATSTSSWTCTRARSRASSPTVRIRRWAAPTPSWPGQRSASSTGWSSKDIFLTETAEFWKAPGVDRQGPQDRGVLPAGGAGRREGRLADEHDAADPVARDGRSSRQVMSRSDAEFFCALAKRLQKLYAGSTKDRDKGFLAANFTYGAKPDEPEMVEVLKEINGVATEDITDKDGKVVYKKGQPINSFAQLTDDGKTASRLLDLHRRHRRGRRTASS